MVGTPTRQPWYVPTIPECDNFTDVDLLIKQRQIDMASSKRPSKNAVDDKIIFPAGGNIQRVIGSSASEIRSCLNQFCLLLFYRIFLMICVLV